MKLTAQHLGEVVNALQSSPANSKGSEKRRATRMELQANVVIAPLGKDGSIGKSFTAITRDISFVGLGLLQSKSLEEGQQVVVRLPRGAKPALLMLCHVLHVRQLADGLYVIGAEFINVADIKEEQLLGQAGDTEMRHVRHLMLN